MIRAQWLIDGRLSALARMHTLPCAFYHKTGVELAASVKDLDRIFQTLQDDLLNLGVVRLKPRVLDVQDMQRATFPASVEYRSLDRYGQIVMIVKTRYYMHAVASGSFTIEMQEEIETQRVALAHYAPTSNSFLH